VIEDVFSRFDTKARVIFLLLVLFPSFSAFPLTKARLDLYRRAKNFHQWCWFCWFM